MKTRVSKRLLFAGLTINLIMFLMLNCNLPGGPTQPPKTTTGISLPQTGQTTSYYTDDDGALKKGVEWPSPRFTNNGNGTITDNLTGLMWEQVPTSSLATWKEALDYCHNLILAGYTDWRLPNRNELESLVNKGEGYTAVWLTAQGFSNVISWFYWSSTTCAPDTTFAWVVIMYDGSLGNDNKTTDYSYIWAVRAGQCGYLLDLPNTGQTTSYYTDDDGALQKGVTLPSPRFTNHGDGTITDNLTGLMWERVPMSALTTWAGALDYCHNLILAGYTDWRLPNRNEIDSLINEGASDPSAWLNSQGFSGVLSSYYWSATTHAQNTGSAWNVSLDYGFIWGTDKTANSCVLAVRGEALTVQPTHPPTPTPVIDMFEDFESWKDFQAVGDSWDDGDNSIGCRLSKDNVTSGQYSLECLYLFQVNNKGASFFKESFAMKDWSTYSKLYVDVFNPTNEALTINFAVCTGVDWVWQESVEYTLVPGLNKDIAFDLLASTYKSEATNWENTAALNNMYDVKRLVFKFNGRAGLESSVFVDAIRLDTDMFEDFEWRQDFQPVGNLWPDGDNSIVCRPSHENVASGQYSLECLYSFQANHKGAAFFKESFAMNDWTKYSGLYMDVYNPENTGLTISVDICTGVDWVWQESVEYPLQPGLNKDIAIDLLTSTFRSEATGWEYIGELQNMNDVKRVVLRVNGPTGLESSVFVDAIRLGYYQSELEGTWKGPLVNQPSYVWTIVIVGHKAVVSLNNVEQYRAVFIYNPDVEPKQIDGRIYSALNPAYVGKTSLAIYKHDGDTLLLAGNEPGITTRPASFVPVGGTAVMALKKQ